MQRLHLLRWFALVVAVFSFQCLESLSDDCRKTRTCDTAPQLGADCRWYYPDGGVWEGGPRRQPNNVWAWPDGTTTATQNIECPPDAGALGDAGLGPIGVDNCGPEDRCDDGLFCDTALDRCVKCLNDSQCMGVSDPNRGALFVCDERIRDCIVCLSDEDCSTDRGFPPGMNCRVDNRTPANNRCVECVRSGDCNPGEICDPDSNQCTSSCTGPGQCAAPRPICNLPASGDGLCVQCVESCQCSGATPQCNMARKECVPCVDDTVCSNGQVCSSANRCVDCVDDRTCGQGTHCDGTTNKCVACVDSSHCTSPESSRCNAQNQCVPCTDDTQCEAPLGVCDVPGGGRCVQCVDNATCPQGSVCDPTGGTCVGCLNNADCSTDPLAARCDTAQRCAPCTSPNHCQGKFNGKDLCRTPGNIGECVECIAPIDCADDVTRSRCNVSQGVCSGCQVDADCSAVPGNRACLAGGAPRCVECTSAAHCVGNPDGLACNTATNTCVECVADTDCTAPGESRCVANQCQPCVNDGGGSHCGHVRNGATVLGVCDTSAGANAGVCVQCTGNQRAACGTTVCNSLTKVCSTFLPGTAGRCQACVSDAHCASTQRCVLETFAGTDIGFSCFPVNEAGACSLTPFSNLVSVSTIDRVTEGLCFLRQTTCSGFNQANNLPCTASTDCGRPNLDDGFCDTGAGVCRLPCDSGSLDCPNGQNASCAGGFCEP